MFDRKEMFSTYSMWCLQYQIPDLQQQNYEANRFLFLIYIFSYALWRNMPHWI